MRLDMEFGRQLFSVVTNASQLHIFGETKGKDVISATKEGASEPVVFWGLWWPPKRAHANVIIMGHQR